MGNRKLKFSIFDFRLTIGGRLTQSAIVNRQSTMRQIRGYAIIEYLLVAAAALGAIMAVRTAVAWKTLEVSVNEINKVDGIPWQ